MLAVAPDCLLLCTWCVQKQYKNGSVTLLISRKALQRNIEPIKFTIKYSYMLLLCAFVSKFIL